MLDFADFIVLNKFEKRGAEDALRDVRKQVARNRKLFKTPPEALPVYPTIASQFNDAGVNALFARSVRAAARAVGAPPALAARGPRAGRHAGAPGDHPGPARALPRGDRGRRPRRPPRRASQAAGAAGRAHGLYRALAALGDSALPAPLERYAEAALRVGGRVDPAPATRPTTRRSTRSAPRASRCSRAGRRVARPRPPTEFSYRVRDREVRGPNYSESLSHLQLPKIATPRFEDWGAQLAFLLTENLPGAYPVHRRHLSVPPRGRGPDAHVRGRGHARAHQPPFPLPRARPPGDAALDRVRLDHAVRRGSGRAARTSTGASATRASRSPRSTT